MPKDASIELEDVKKISMKAVVEMLESQVDQTVWTEKTKVLSINYAKHLGEVYGNHWYAGKLPRDSFEKICLPEHDHLGASVGNLFPDETTITDAVDQIGQLKRADYQDCLDHIASLKQSIKTEGFSSTLVLVMINGKLKHVDGLHRVLAMGELLQEGFEYSPIDVFLCDNTRIALG